MIRPLCWLGVLLAGATQAICAERVEVVTASLRDPPRANGRATCNPHASDDGRYIVHCSFASNLVDGMLDGNAGSDVFLHDRDTGRNVLVSHAAWSRQVSASGGSMSEENSLVAISGDGAAVFFVHDALDLTPEGGNGTLQLYRYETATGAVSLVTRASGGGPSDDDVVDSLDDVDERSLRPSFSGKRIVFTSRASNLVAGQVDGVGSHDVFAHDAGEDSIRLLSHVDGQPLQAAGFTGRQVDITPDGRYAAYDSLGVWRHDLDADTRLSVSRTAGTGQRVEGFKPRIASDGRTVAYVSLSTQIVAGQLDTNSGFDLFAWDADSDASFLVSRSAGQAQRTLDRATDAYWMRADGAQFLVNTRATDHRAPPDTDGQLSDVLRYGRNGDAVLVSTSMPQANLDAVLGAVSPSGRQTSVRASNYGWYIHDAATGQMREAGADFVDAVPLPEPRLCAVVFFVGEVAHPVCTIGFPTGLEYQDLWPDAGGTPRLAPRAGPGMSRRHAVGGEMARVFVPPARTLSADGKRVLFRNRGEGWWVSDRHGRVALPPHIGPQDTLGVALYHTLSADGRRVAFVARGDELRPGAGNNAYLFDVDAGTLRAITALPQCECTIEDISGDGRRVLLASFRPELAGDAGLGSASRLYLYDDDTRALTLVSRRSAAAGGAPTTSEEARISRDGRYIVFASSDPRIVGNPAATGQQLYRFDTLTGSMSRISHAPGQPGLPLAGSAFLRGMDTAGLRVLFSTEAAPVPGVVDGNAGPDLYLHDAADGSVILVTHRLDSLATTLSRATSLGWLSGDGRHVAIHQAYGDAVAGYAPTNLQPFLYDVQARTWEAIARNPDGSQPNAEVSVKDISHAGDFLLLVTRAGNVFGANGPARPVPEFAVYRWRRGAGATLLTRSPADPAALAPGLGGEGQLDDSGRVAVFETDARGLSAEDGNGEDDVYRAELRDDDEPFEDGFEQP